MFDYIRHDFDVYKRSLANRAYWGMVLYRFGRWAERIRFAPLRWICNKTYGFINIFWPIFSGVSIDRSTEVGERFHIVHAGMVVIHPGVRFGDRCGVMHNVTIGQNMNSDVPTIGNDVFIGTGAVILGEINIGDGARIASNSLVVCDVPANAMAMGVPAKIYPNMGMLREVPASLPLHAPKPVSASVEAVA
jgi:serine O-acetyltransferase